MENVLTCKKLQLSIIFAHQYDAFASNDPFNQLSDSEHQSCQRGSNTHVLMFYNNAYLVLMCVYKKSSFIITENV